MKEHLLVTIGKERFNTVERAFINFTGEDRSNQLVNDLENTPHAYVLACLMDRQIKAEKAWAIPFKIYEVLGSFDIFELNKITLADYQKIFKQKSLHRFNDSMAEIFSLAVKDIMNKYGGDASQIWVNEPSSAKVVYEFLLFKGGGKKIATMAANILARQFKIPFSDYYSIDISPDTHIIRVIRRSGLVASNADADSIIYKAREIYPSFPGIIDFSCWEIGRTWCKPINPLCDECLIQTVCQYALS